MNQYIQDSAWSVESRGMRAYLRANGWEKVRAFGEKGDVYERGGVAADIVVPASSEFADYGTRVLQIADVLGRTEDRDSDAVLRDLSLADVDLIRVEGEEDGQRGVQVDAGVTLVSMAREALLAAACAADRPQRAYRAAETAELWST